MMRESGFTLIKVMLMSTMASVVVFGALKETIVQERLSGNFQKDLNARLMAEKGVFESAKQIKAALAGDGSLTVTQLVANQQAQSGGGLIGDDAQYSATLRETPDGLLEIVSKGQRFHGDAINELIARFELVPGGGESPFSNAVTGCKGVNLGGSGSVDSYDSSQGTYAETKAQQGHVNTVLGDADVTLDGHSPVLGDVKASGVIYLKGTSPVIGNVHSNTGVDISWGSGVRVQGNVNSLGFYLHRGGEITGVVRVKGDATMNWGSLINNQANDPYAIQYNGSGQFDDTGLHVQHDLHYSDAYFQVDPDIDPVRVYDASSEGYDPANPNKECDPFSLPENMPDVMANNSGADFLVGSAQSYMMSPILGIYTHEGADTAVMLAREEQIYIFDALSQKHGITGTDAEYVYDMQNFKLFSDGVLTISGGDVIWLVDGDFILDGDAKLIIEDGSSLTVFTTGKTILGASASVITERQGMTDSGLPTLSIFSSYSGLDGFQMMGATDMYAMIYAPLTQVKLSGSGQLYGTVRGATITSTGDSGVHFDKALEQANFSGGQIVGGEPTLKFKGWFYQHPQAISSTNTGEVK